MKNLLGAVLLLSSFNCIAGNPTCSGEVTAIGLSASSYLSVSVVGAGTNLRDVNVCNLDKTDIRFSATACKSLQSLLMAAKASREHVTLWFYEGQFSSCAMSWDSLTDHGFYHIRTTRP